MRVVIAPDSFKGSLSAVKVCAAIADGWRRVFPDAVINQLPVADGGEGTAHTLATATGGELRLLSVTGPLREPVDAQCALLPDRIAVVELAEAAGLTQVPQEKRDPKRTTTFGVGEMLHVAGTSGEVQRLIIALGGSATNDGGAGVLQALGVAFRDANGALVDARSGAAVLRDIASADFGRALQFPDLVIEIACDVDNPLLGSSGASAVFGPQKGATELDIAFLDRSLAHYADVLTAATKRDVRDVPGAGAAGGAAAGLLWLFPQATLRPGTEIVLDAIGFDDAVRTADIVLTGEGRLDTQTLGGKVIAGVARRARQVQPGIFVGALVGSVAPELSVDIMETIPIDAVLPIAPGPVTLDDAMTNAVSYLTAAAERAARWYRRTA